MKKKQLFKRLFELETIVHSMDSFNLIKEIDQAYNYYLHLLMKEKLYKEYLLFIKDKV